MLTFTTQPPKECSLQQFGIEPVGLRPSMLARHGNARRMNDVRFNIVRPKPAGQPEAITAGLECDGNAFDFAAKSDYLISPALQEAQ